MEKLEPQGTTVEAEVKYELSNARFLELPKILIDFGFTAVGPVTQEDHYVFYEQGALGGLSFDRYRKTRGKNGVTYSWNRKVRALDSQGNKVRVEDGKVIAEEDYKKEIAKASSSHPVITKQRQDFSGNIENFVATVSLDQVGFGNQQKCFLEVEILTTLEQGVKAKELCKIWAKESLGISANPAPGYLKQYLSQYKP